MVLSVVGFLFVAFEELRTHWYNQQLSGSGDVEGAVLFVSLA